MAEWTRRTPWRQGLLLPNEAVKPLLGELPELSDAVVVVATHDCDLAQTTENEPCIELVIGQRLTTSDGNFTHAKTARTLHIFFDGEDAFWAEFNANAKKLIPKSELVDYYPRNTSRLSPSNLATFQRWLASRYRRSAFPDEFERRLKENRLTERLAKAVKPHGSYITAILFDVDEGKELNRNGPDDAYLLDIILLHAVEPDGKAAAIAADQAKKAIKSAFKNRLFDPSTEKWQYIKLRYIDVLSEEGLTYRQFTLMKPWRLEYVSLGADPQQPIPMD